MASYKVVATVAGTTPGGNSVRKARCEADNIRQVIQKLMARFASLDSVQSLTLAISLDDEEVL